MVYRYFALMTILSLMLITVTCQSFQYSKGWTNGKRGDVITKYSVYQPQELKLNYPESRTINEHTTVPAIIHWNLKKLRMLLQGNNNNQFHLLPCELLNIQRPTPKLDKPSNHILKHLSIYKDNNANSDN